MSRRRPVGTPQTLREGLRRPLLVFTASAAFTAIGVLMIRAGGIDAVYGVIAVLFFGLGVLVGAILLAGGGRKLRLDESGFQMSTGLGRVERIGWHEITGFSVHRIRSSSYVAYGLQGGAPSRERRARGVVRSLGVRNVPDGMLPTLYGRMSARELADYLNEWRRAGVHGRSE